MPQIQEEEILGLTFTFSWVLKYNLIYLALSFSESSGNQQKFVRWPMGSQCSPSAPYAKLAMLLVSLACLHWTKEKTQSFN